MRNKKLKDVLPELAQIMAKDLRDFNEEWEDVLQTYTKIFGWIPKILLWRSEDMEKSAVEIIEKYIKMRSLGFPENDLVPAYIWLACELGDIPRKTFDKLMDELEMEIYGFDEGEDDKPQK
jgi:hypothetical protein